MSSVLTARKEIVQRVQECPRFGQFLKELEIETVQALAEEDPHILFIQQHALVGRDASANVQRRRDLQVRAGRCLTQTLTYRLALAADHFVGKRMKSGDVRVGGKIWQGLADARLHLAGSPLCEG